MELLFHAATRLGTHIRMKCSHHGFFESLELFQQTAVSLYCKAIADRIPKQTMFVLNVDQIGGLGLIDNLI